MISRRDAKFVSLLSSSFMHCKIDLRSHVGILCGMLLRSSEMDVSDAFSPESFPGQAATQALELAQCEGSAKALALDSGNSRNSPHSKESSWMATIRFTMNLAVFQRLD